MLKYGEIKNLLKNIDTNSFIENNKIWILADTTREYIGDYASLKSQGFMYEDAEGLVYWHNVAAYH